MTIRRMTILTCTPRIMRFGLSSYKQFLERAMITLQVRPSNRRRPTPNLSSLRQLSVADICVARRPCDVFSAMRNVRVLQLIGSLFGVREEILSLTHQPSWVSFVPF